MLLPHWSNINQNIYNKIGEKMRRIKITFCYDGSSFRGYQKQPKLRTVQGVLEHVLRKIDVEPILVSASGRTDAKVHALCQVAHFDIVRDSISADNLLYIFKRQLPPDIKVRNVEEVAPDFHARFDVKSKEYWYKFHSLKDVESTPFISRYYSFVPYEINLEHLNDILALYIGTHDFTAFTTMPEDYDCIRTIHHCYCIFDEKEQCFIIKIKGTGFMQYMVRILIGYAFEVYRGRETKASITDLFNSRNRQYVHSKMLPEGLYLVSVNY